MQVDVAGDGDLEFALLKSDSVGTGDSIELGQGLVVRMIDNNIRKGGVEWSHLATFLVEKAENVPLDVAVALLSAWIYDTLKGRKAKVSIGRTELQLDDNGQIKKVIRERLEREE
jgi:hypothetical protein